LRLASCDLRLATRLPETPPLGRSCSSSVGRRHAAAASRGVTRRHRASSQLLQHRHAPGRLRSSAPGPERRASRSGPCRVLSLAPCDPAARQLRPPIARRQPPLRPTLLLQVCIWYSRSLPRVLLDSVHGHDF